MIVTHSIDHQEHKAIVSWGSNFYVKASHLTKFPSSCDVPHYSITGAIKEVTGSPALSEGQFIPEMETQDHINIVVAIVLSKRDPLTHFQSIFH
jgi:hypothetical protein